MISGHGGNIHDLARRIGCRPTEIEDLSSNVNPLGPPPGLLDYLARNLDAVSVLPEVDSRGITQDYAGRLGISPDRLIAGNGTTQFIYSLPGVLQVRKALIVGPTYSDYADACRLHGVTPGFFLSAEPDDFQPDLDRLEAAAAGADTVFICNPNNPTGTLIPGERLRRLCRRHPHVRFVVDESYLPFVADGEAHSLVRSGLENLITLLSISKIFRIPGLRVGFLAAPPAVIGAFADVLWPWSVNGIGQAAVRFLADAGPALDAFVAGTRGYLENERRGFEKGLAAGAGLKVYPSTTSFILIRLPETLSAAAVCSCLAAERILIRNCGNFIGLSERFIRISPKGAATNRRVTDRLVEMGAAESPRPRPQAGPAQEN